MSPEVKFTRPAHALLSDQFVFFKWKENFVRNNRLKRGVPLYFHYYTFSILFNIFLGFKNQNVLKKIKKLGIIDYFVCLKELWVCFITSFYKKNLNLSSTSNVVFLQV